MKKTIILLCLAILLPSFASADIDGGIILKISNTSLSVGDYIYIYGQTLNNTALIIDNGNFGIGEYIICPTIINVTVGNTTSFYKTDCYSNLTASFNLPLKKGFINSSTNCTNTNYEIVNSATQTKLDTCKSEKNLCDSQYNSLYGDYSKINDTNKLYMKCVADAATCTAEKNPLQSKIDALQKEQDNSKNNIFLYGGIGIAIGVLGFGIVTGRWFGPKARHQEENYQRGAAA